MSPELKTKIITFALLDLGACVGYMLGHAGASPTKTALSLIGGTLFGALIDAWLWRRIQGNSESKL